MSKIAQNRFQARGMVSVSTIAGTSALGKTREGKLEKGASVEVTFFGEQVLSGIVQDLDKVTATIVFGVAVGAWAVTVPRDWVKKSEGGWLLEIG